MNPESTVETRSFAFFSSGAAFSCAVLGALLRRELRPAMLVLPGYPPAPPAVPAGVEIETGEPRNSLLALAGDVDTVYAPQARQEECAAQIAARGIDFLLVACWPWLIAPELIASAACAALNLHPSLLPRYRGADPLAQQRAAGDPRFGVSLHLLDERFDHGDIVAQAELGGGGECADLEAKCAELGALLFLDALRAYPDWRPVAQDSL